MCTLPEKIERFQPARQKQEQESTTDLFRCLKHNAYQSMITSNYR